MSSASRLVEFPSPQTVIGRFVTRRTIRSAAFVALIFGAYVAAKSIGYESAFPSVQSRIAVTASFTKNVGLTALLGAPHHLETVAGFAAWNTFIVMVMIGAIWAYLTTTRLFRGEEDQGRWELMLSGLTTARRATANVLIGFGTSLIVLFLVTAVSFIAIGRLDTVRIGTGPSLFFALATVTAAFMFAAVGALASQLMPTRARAATISTAVFGIFFLVRAAGDITSAHWLVKVSPLGWIELLEPLTGSQPLWLIPIILFTAILVALTIYLAGRRDLGASIFADHDTAKPRLLLLRGPLTAAIRLTRTSSLSWLLGLAALAAFFGLLTKTAADAITSSLNTEKIITNLTQNSQQIGAQTFLGVVFFFLMTVTMCYAASAVSAMREDEAQGYLDNLLVRPIGRMRWLLGRLTLAVVVIVMAAVLSSLVVWLCMQVIGVSVTWHTLLLAGFNMIAPTLLILGIGVFAMGVLPRLTGFITFGIIAWSFLIQMLTSGLNLNHWLLDSSIFSHVAFAPAVDPNWHTSWMLVVIGLILTAIGALVFNRRDLATE